MEVYMDPFMNILSMFIIFSGTRLLIGDFYDFITEETDEKKLAYGLKLVLTLLLAVTTLFAYIYEFNLSTEKELIIETLKKFALFTLLFALGFAILLLYIKEKKYSEQTKNINRETQIKMKDIFIDIFTEKERKKKEEKELLKKLHRQKTLLLYKRVNRN
jgi:hypothetical protein